MVSNEVFRGRYRKSFEKPEAIEPNKPLEYSFSLHTQNYTFRKGHRVMVQVQSTWVPHHRPQPPDVHRQHLRSQAQRLPEGHAPHPPLRTISLARHDPRRRKRRGEGMESCARLDWDATLRRGFCLRYF
ncbi:MAG: CocE/NonD family hydrolase C-terminal non-catalytic domain-containing protein [Bryobacterales bacterium]